MLSTNSLPAEEASWVALGAVEQIGLGQGRCFRIGALQLAIFRLRSGEVYALDAACPHRGGPLADGLIGGQTVICPLHGYRFSLSDGRSLDGEFNTNSYPVEIRDGGLYVKLSEST